MKADHAGHAFPLQDLSPRLGLGTLGFKRADPDAATAVLDQWVTLGGRLIDTAAVYGAGESELVIGEWLRSRGARGDVILLTKGGHPDANSRSRLDPDSISADLTASLQRLGVDTVDIYLLHRDDSAIPVGEMIDALSEHVRAGLVRSIGVSNWTPSRVDEANAYAAAHGLTALDAVSNYFGLATRMRSLWLGTLSSTGRAARAWHARTGMPLIAWSTQSQGWFSDGFDPKGRGADAFYTYDSPQNVERRARAFELAERRGCSAAQLALAWVLNQPIAPIALVGARTPEELRTTWAASQIALTAEELSWLEVGGPEE
jgi:aryl-alcohol dehydrogenase-like predicted oxidoreductase